MNLCIDQGNTAVKAGVFEGDILVYTTYTDRPEPGFIQQIAGRFPIQHCIISSTAAIPGFFIQELENASVSCMELSHTSALPFTNAYTTPETLGKDRLAAVAGACTLMPAADVLIVDAGTAITFDFVDASGVYQGGNIAPGVEMRAKALNVFTHRLPLVELSPVEQFMGIDTRSAINNGVIYGAVFEIDGYIEKLLLNYPKLSTFLTGGSSFYFDGMLKNRTFAVKNLVLTGLNRILNFNVQ
jgi:type III pantothenate kinase